MMDDETAWQDAALPADSQPIGPVKPDTAASPGDAADFDDLETGIASIFAALHAAGSSDAEPGDDEAEPDEAHTFQLLSELDRLWQRPSP
jgi:hypothetical protein